MSKQILTTGVFEAGNYSWGVIGLNVSRDITRVDNGDTGLNLSLLTGRKRWTFSAEVMSDSGKTIVLTQSAIEIFIAFADDVYAGTGYIFNIQEQGRIDDKIILNITGEFISPTYFAKHLNNGVNWIHEDSDTTADGWAVGSATPSIIVDGEHGTAQRCADTSGSVSCTFNINHISGNHLEYIKYEYNALTSLRIFRGPSSYTTLAGGAGLRVEYQVLALSGSEDRVSFVANSGGGGNWVNLYKLLISPIADQI